MNPAPPPSNLAVDDDDAPSGILESIRYQPRDNDETSSPPARLQVLDQLLLPDQCVYIDVPDCATAWSVIRNMQIRGAPLIAVVAILSLAVELQTLSSEKDEEWWSDDYIPRKLEYLGTSRPTAVNLFHAIQEVQEVVWQAKQQSTGISTTTNTTVKDRMIQAVVQHAEFMLERDRSDNRAIGEHGAQEILLNASGTNVTILTLCNTGSLATAGYGTALGVVRSLHACRRLQGVVALETRPYNQGSRLTCFELLADALPNAQLLCDSMAAAYMKKWNGSNNNNQNNHKNNTVRLACVVGADRVAANGDTANKIGTYQLAVTAQHHGVPFYVAAPLTTLDVHNTPTGDDIVIEERPAHELRESARAPPNMPVWNPAFDVTPAKYITGIVTEKGVIHPNAQGEFDVAAFVAHHTGKGIVTASPPNEIATTDQKIALSIPSTYQEQTTESLPRYIAERVPEAMKALEASSAEALTCVEMGDGNLNLVFIVSNKLNPQAPKVIVKQALPYVRCVGESWPLTLDRAYFEYKALEAEKAACPEFVPNLYYFSRPHALIVMEYLAPPILIFRKGLIQGIRYPTVAADLGTFCAKTLFRTSGFHLSTTELRAQVQHWSQNADMCALTEQVVFTEPYLQADNNRWTSPQLDADKAAIEADGALKQAAAEWKIKFVTQTQALIHADLHTGSVMCAPVAGQTFVIDPEFAFYGPAAFDTGALVANLLLAYVSQEGHRSDDQGEYAEWILKQIQTFWNTFALQFITLWNDPAQHTGFCYGREVLGDDDEGQTACQTEFMKTMLADTLGFAGMKMLRRIVGIAHVEDLESIADVNVRARCERRGLALAQTFITKAASFETIEDAIRLARETPY